MKKWKYFVTVVENPSPENQKGVLNDCGAMGWELVTVGEYRENPIYYFKKPKG